VSTENHRAMNSRIIKKVIRAWLEFHHGLFLVQIDAEQKPDVSNIVVAQKYEVSKIMGISKSVRNEQLNENSSTCSARRFLVMGKFGT
jgi:hypothetical protein